ncbi:hypothetical protein HMPREF0322_00363 [Desulfitobacterium hafniense DP7]|uniref:Uncharacterized protein n=1 Tax=Desulfitobacterium hafniense DP7 TaxID=537010 RepID=G9XHD9_DESHA|nr:hypothetical protein HMPREF0322_00363 [Desulfitobacterium hafniense DP7]
MDHFPQKGGFPGLTIPEKVGDAPNIRQPIMRAGIKDMNYLARWKEEQAIKTLGPDIQFTQRHGLVMPVSQND